MRSVVADRENETSGTGLLLFDEPSASLDPTAEHGEAVCCQFCSCCSFFYSDLFERLRRLRGSKTMVFSSHRFGNLTRHADIILWVIPSIAGLFLCLTRI